MILVKFAPSQISSLSTWGWHGGRYTHQISKGKKCIQDREQCREICAVRHQHQADVMQELGDIYNNGFECWMMTRADLTKLISFHTSRLCRILRIFWSEKIPNRDLLRRWKQEYMDAVITRRRWGWLGQVLQREPQAITRMLLQWTPDIKRKRGRLRTTWRRTVESEMKAMQHSWGSLPRLGQDRQKWREFVAALNTTGCNGCCCCCCCWWWWW